ncbi:hypothetical protein [Nocardiopsis sp. FIRDI 009]|uniref:hypothetical protein n=1 Tax=Nocardiopsis sp. FIRDI 009 TaxID=714197 RepID=UPI000E255C54|nr:hypothetical protein [Nocardiopsis sp. FIRDI 009]
MTTIDLQDVAEDLNLVIDTQRSDAPTVTLTYDGSTRQTWTATVRLGTADTDGAVHELFDRLYDVRDTELNRDVQGTVSGALRAVAAMTDQS